MNLPPEVYGALSVAQNHLNAAQFPRRYYRWEKRKRKHLEKVQKLVARAAKLLRGKEVESI